MSLKSTALANYIATTGSLKAALDGGFLRLFSGPVPATADAAIDGSSVELCLISNNNTGTTGLTFATPATGGILTKTSSETWSGTVEATGTATFWRFCQAGDNGAAADTTAAHVRLQGTIGTTVASEGVLTSVALTAGNLQTIDLFQVQ